MKDKNNAQTKSTVKTDSLRYRFYLTLSRAFREELDAEGLDSITRIHREVDGLASSTEEEHFTLGNKLLQQFLQKVPKSKEQQKDFSL